MFPGLFSVPRPITTPDIPVIVAASILSTYESPILPMTKAGAQPETEKKGVRLFRAIGGQQILRLVLKTKPSDYYKALWDPCATTSMWLGALEFHDSLERLLQVFEATGFGDARVNAQVPPHALVTLEEVVSLYREGKLKCKLEVERVASSAVFVDPDTKLVEAMKTMCEKRIRRLFLRGQEGVFVSDRNVIAFLFSPKALAVAKDTPEMWTDALVSSLPTTKASLVSPQDRVEDVGSMPEARRDVFVLSDRKSMISRWDLVIKPWKARKLHLSI